MTLREAYERAFNNFLKSAELPDEIIESTEWSMFGGCGYLELKSDGKSCVLDLYTPDKDSLTIDLPVLNVDWIEWEGYTQKQKLACCKEQLEDIIVQLKHSFSVYIRRFN